MRWVGLPVSAGTIEGRPRVILDMAEAHLDQDQDDDLVFTFPQLRASAPAHAAFGERIARSDTSKWCWRVWINL